MRSWVYRYTRAIAGTRLAAGAFLVALAIILVADDQS
jgi:hypothetical protein